MPRAASTRYVALLRGVNVGGRNKVSMAELRTTVEELGHSEVSTFIQSGNILFTAAGPVAPSELEAAVRDRFDLSVSVALRTAKELRDVLAGNPFPNRDPSHLHVGFLVEPVPASVVAGLDGGPFRPEEFSIRGRHVYLHLPNGMGRAKLPGFLDRKLTVPMTARNWNTVSKLADLAAGPRS